MATQQQNILTFLTEYEGGQLEGAIGALQRVVGGGRQSSSFSSVSGNLLLSPGIDYYLNLIGPTILTLPGATSLAVSNFLITSIIVGQLGAGGNILTLPTGVKWPGGTAPSTNTTLGQFDYFTFVSPDGGNTWLGRY